MGNCSPRKLGCRIRIRKLFSVGQIYTFCIEDSTDEDYNDFYINIAAWDKKG